MRIVHYCLLLAVLFLLGTSFQCTKCQKGERLLEGTRPWLPLKGKTQLTFSDEAGVESIFKIKVVDTIQTYSNVECSAQYRSERIETVLYLNAAGTDSIFVQLGPPNSVCLHAASGDTLYMSTCRFFNAPASLAVVPLTNYDIAGRTYPDVRVFLANEGNNKSTDSIVLAKGFGIAAFKYKNRNYRLK
ncbi:MAG TPA: hypothetical protein VL095_16880 [Flavisolibacter sp.]|nr:hypothetical protein [Flavisolibacter sp.]